MGTLARCGTENDFVSNDLDDFIPIDPNYVADYSRIRYSRDSKLDSRGKELLDFCIGNNLRILNGGIRGDSLGNFTCFNVHGQSVVDYVIASEEVTSHVLTFKVSTFNHFYLIIIVNSLLNCYVHTWILGVLMPMLVLRLSLTVYMEY